MSIESDQARLAELNSILGLTPPAPVATPDSGGLFGRVGQQAANLPSNIMQDMIQGYQGAYNLIAPRGTETQLTEVPKPYDIKAPQTFGESAVDVGAGLASMIPAALAPETAVSKGAQIFGVEQRASKILGAAAGWGLTGTPHGAGEAGIQAGFGVLGASTEGVPMRARIPLALAGGIAGYLEGARRSPTQGAVMAGVNTILPFAEPALEAVLARAKKINAIEIQKDGGNATLQNQPSLDLTRSVNTTGEGIYGAGELAQHDVFSRQPLPAPDVTGFPAPGEVPPASPDPLRLATGPAPAPPAGLPFFEVPGNGLHIVGQRGVETPGWEKGPIPLSPSRQAFQDNAMGENPTPNFMGGERASYGRGTDPYDVFAGVPPPERAGIPEPAPASVAPLQSAPHVQDQFKPKLQGLLKDSGFGEPGQMPAEGQEANAHKLGASLKTQAEVNQLKNGKKLLEAEFEKAMTAGDMDLASELTFKQQFLSEAIEYAEGHPGKINTYLSRDPNYQPSVPGKAYKKAQATPEAVTLPKKGDTIAAKRGPMPVTATVTKVSKGKIYYQVEDFVSGESTHHVATPEEFATLQKEGVIPENPPEPIEPAAAKPESTSFQPIRFQENGKWVEAKVVSKEGTTLKLEVDDPIRGIRTAFINESEAHLMPITQGEITNGGVPFQEIKGAPTIKSQAAGEFDGLDDIIQGRDTPKYVIGDDGQKIPLHEIPSLEDDAESLVSYLQRYKSQTIGQAAKELDGLGGVILKDMLGRLLKASGQKDFPINFTTDDQGWNRIGFFSWASGKIELSWQHTQAVLRDWKTMNPVEQTQAIIGMTHLLGHEISHAAVRLGAKAGLEINGRSLVDAIEHEVFSLPLATRQFIAGEIKEAIGEPGIISNYLAGDIDTVWSHYKKQDSSLTKLQAQKFAAEEFMVELMSAELHKRMEVRGLPGMMRAAINRLKNVVKGVLNFFSRNESNVAALQNLQDIAKITLNKFGEATPDDFAQAFPSSRFWEQRATKFQEKRSFEPPVEFKEPSDPMDWIVMDYAGGHPPAPTTSDTFLRNEALRAGIRTASGALVGGLVAPTVSRDQISVSEGILLGGIMGAFGPAFARRIVNSDLAVEAAVALRIGGGNPIKSLEALMGGKSLRQLGGEALFTERNGVSQFVRAMEIGFGVNFDKKLRGVLEHSRGLASEQMAIVYDAMRRAKDFKVESGLEVATLQFLEGKLDGPSFVKLLGTEDEKAYGTLITTARSAVDNLQTMVASGLKEGAFKRVVQDSVGSYLGKFYRAYTKGEFNMVAFDKAKADLQKAFPEYSNDVSDAIMYQHMREVQADHKVFGRVSGAGQQMDPNLWKRRLATESEIEAQQAIVASLTPKDAEFQVAKEKLSWMQSHAITDGWAAWLGEIKDPKERALRTFQKLYSSSISGKTFDLLSTHVDSFGLKFAYGAEELSKVTQAGAMRLKTLSLDSTEFATLQKQLSELKYYVPLPAGAQYGKLSGKMVNRFVRDEISTNTSPFKWMQQPVFRAISGFNNVIKVGRTALNPITVIRNYIQMPMFGLISKTSMTDLVDAWKAIGARGDLHKLMLREGITTADFSAAELTDGPGKMFSGFFDEDAAIRLAARGYDKALEIYRAPDMVLRAGTFMSAVRRFGGTLDAGLKDAAVVKRAVDFTNRYTMNYHAVPNIIKVGRQLPFVSLFLSYTTEITRILKNLVQDAISPGADSAGRLHALGILGGMAAIPAMLLAAGESSLSPKDRKEWEKVKALSPGYSKFRFRIPLNRDGKGNFHYADITNLLPADSYSMMVRAVASGDFEAAAKVNPVVNLENTPLLNIATEQIAGKDLHTDRTIQGLDRVRAVLKEILPPVTPGIGYEAERITNAFTPNANGSLGLTNTRTGRSVMPSDIVANYLTGMKFGNVNPDVIQRGFIAEAKQKIAEQQQILRQTTGQNIPDAARKAAQEKFSNAVKEIVFQMHEKLQLAN